MHQSDATEIHISGRGPLLPFLAFQYWLKFITRILLCWAFTEHNDTDDENSHGDEVEDDDDKGDDDNIEDDGYDNNKNDDDEDENHSNNNDDDGSADDSNDQADIDDGGNDDTYRGIASMHFHPRYVFPYPATPVGGELLQILNTSNIKLHFNKKNLLSPLRLLSH